MKRFFSLLFFLFFSFSILQAENIPSTETQDFSELWVDGPTNEPDFKAKFIKMLLILGVLIAFMFIASWALKRMMKSKMTHLNLGKDIRVLESRYISPRASVYLIEVKGKTFLIAESPSQVTLLGSID